MQSVITELFHGNIQPYIAYVDKNSSYGKQMKILSRSEERLRDRLKATDDIEGSDLLASLVSAQHELDLMTAVDKFSIGFKLGVLLMAECFTGQDAVLIPEE